MDHARNYEDMSRKDLGEYLGEYLRDFIMISEYLVDKDGLSEREQLTRLLEGFLQPIRVAIFNHLAITDHDVLPNDGYPFPSITSAARWVLSSRAMGASESTDRESRYSQAKLELYGLFCCLKATRLFTIGVERLIVEMDAVTRWIAAILLFDFELMHVPADKHTGADGLSRRLAHLVTHLAKPAKN